LSLFESAGEARVIAINGRPSALTSLFHGLDADSWGVDPRELASPILVEREILGGLDVDCGDQ
jgi:hypothetical protein